MQGRYGSAIRLTHIATGLVAVIRDYRNRITPAMNKTVRSLLAAKLAKLAEDPEWKEGSGVIQRGVGKPLVRTWTLCPYRSVRDMRTGKSVPFEPEMLDGRIDGLIEENLRREMANGPQDSQVLPGLP
jgi:protein subunit release factor B